MASSSVSEDFCGDADWTCSALYVVRAGVNLGEACVCASFISPMRPSRVRIDPGKDAMMKEIYNRVIDLSCCHLRTRVVVFSFWCTVSSAGSLSQHRWTADLICVDHHHHHHHRCKQLALWLSQEIAATGGAKKGDATNAIAPTLCQQTKWVDLPHLKRLPVTQGVLVQMTQENENGDSERDDGGRFLLESLDFIQL